MGWFDKQVRQRKMSDQGVFEDSIFRMASVVLGRPAPRCWRTSGRSPRPPLTAY